jgi:hypothetical protein
LVKLEEEGLKVFLRQKTLKLIQNKGIQKDFLHSIFQQQIINDLTIKKV